MYVGLFVAFAVSLVYHAVRLINENGLREREEGRLVASSLIQPVIRPQSLWCVGVLSSLSHTIIVGEAILSVLSNKGLSFFFCLHGDSMYVVR